MITLLTATVYLSLSYIAYEATEWLSGSATVATILSPAGAVVALAIDSLAALRTR